MSESDEIDNDGYRLNLEPYGVQWPAYEHRELVLRRLHELVWANGLEWQIEDRQDSPELRVVNWICPTQEHCWLCIEYLNGTVQLIQASFPEVDSQWSLQLASAIVRVVVTFQLR